MPYVRSVPADPDLDRLAVVRVRSERLGQSDEGERHGFMHVVRRYSGRQRHALGLAAGGLAVAASRAVHRALLARFAVGGVVGRPELQVRTERPTLEQHRLARLGLGGDGHIAHVPLAKVPLERAPVQVAWSDVVGKRSGADLAVERPLDVGPVPSDTHDVRLPTFVDDGGDLARVDALEPRLDAAGDAFCAEVEVAQVAVAGALAGRDVVERRLHVGGELGVDQAGELPLEQVVGGERGEGGNQLLTLLADVPAGLDGLDDAGVGARASDALGLEKLHQARVGEPRRRLGLVPFRPHLAAAQRLVDGEWGKRLVTVVEGGLGIVAAFDVGAEEPWEQHGAAAGAEGQAGILRRLHDAVQRRRAGQLRLDARGDELQARLGHLRGDRALPDEIVQSGLDTCEAMLVGRAHLRARRTDGFVRLLGVARRLPVLTWRRAEVGVAVALRDRLSARVDGLFGEVGGVGAHVGDVAVLVEALRHAHGVARRKAELAAGLLLERRGGERRGGCAGRFPFLHRRHAPRSLAGSACQSSGILGRQQRDVAARLDALFQPPGVGVEVAPARDAHAGDVRERALEAVLVLGEQRGEVVVRRGHEPHPVALAQHEQPHGDALHPPGRKPGRDLAPQQRADGVSDQAVEHAARLLGIDQVLVDRACALERVLDGAFGDLVEHHALDGHLRLKQVDQVPPDRLTFAVFVRRDVELVGVLDGFLELLDDVSLAR